MDLAAELKEKKKKGIAIDHYRGMNVALIFEKTSTRTRCSFETAAHDMGMGTTYLAPSASQIGKKKVSRILRVCWEECLTVLSIGAMVRRL